MSRFDGRPIPYGSARPEPGGPEIALAGGTALRLSHGPYPFAEPPDLIGNGTVEARLALLREHLGSLCGPWDRPARAFLDAYFAWIDGAIGAHAAAIAALAAWSGGIFAPADWSFAALRPLPQAHVAADAGAPVRVDFAFWTGVAIVAIELVGSASPRRQRKDELARLETSGVILVPVPAGTLQQEGERLLGRLLPPVFQRFWDGVVPAREPVRRRGAGRDRERVGWRPLENNARGSYAYYRRCVPSASKRTALPNASRAATIMRPSCTANGIRASRSRPAAFSTLKVATVKPAT